MTEWLSAATIPPGLILVGGGLLLAISARTWRLPLVLIFPLLTLYWVWSVPDQVGPQLTLLGQTLQPLAPSDTGRLFASVFGIMALAGGLFAVRIASRLELSAAFVYAGSAIGVTFAGDWLTLFLFWEAMAVGSTLVLWAARSDAAHASAKRYLLLHLLGGMLLLLGITGHAQASGSLAIAPMLADSPAHWLILAGVLLNAGAPPFSAWVADAYPEATPGGTVFLSAFTTKTAVFVLIIAFPGEPVLIPIGLYMVFYGILYALLENDMRRILAYSIVNQVGFMVTAIGIGTQMALAGASLHAFAHIIYKGLLLMSAGVVLYRTGMRRCTDLGGLFQSMPWTTLLGIIGALAISAFPLTSGFTTKSMIGQAAADAHLMWVWFALVAASAGVFLHAGIKFPWFVFFQKDSGLRPADAPIEMLLAMLLFAALCIGIGIHPDPLYALLPNPVEYHAYSGIHLVTQLQLLLFAGLAFFVMLPQMRRTLTITLDLDWIYRRLLVDLVHTLDRILPSLYQALAGQTGSTSRHLMALLRKHHGPQGALARSWPIGSMAMWVALILATSLLLYLE